MIIFLGICSIISFLVFLGFYGASESAMHEIFSALFLLNSSVLLAVVEAVRNVRKELAGE